MGGKNTKQRSGSSGDILDIKKSKSRSSSSLLDENEEDQFEPVKELTFKEKQIIKATWNRIEMDAEKIGLTAFDNFFKTNPSAKRQFVPFKSIDIQDDKYNTILQEHGVRVLSTIGKMVKRLDQSEEHLVIMIRDLGMRHGAIYKAKSSYIKVIGPHFISSIRHCLGKEWNSEYESAYRHMFSILTYHMRQALTAAGINYGAQHH